MILTDWKLGSTADFAESTPYTKKQNNLKNNNMRMCAYG